MTPKRHLVLRVIEIALIVAVCLSSFLIFYYADFADTLDNAMLLGDSIVDGNFAHYYEYAAHNADMSTVYTANYDVSLYAVFLVWNLPTFILHRVAGIDYMHSLATLLWCKAMIATALVVCALLIRKILALWIDDKRRTATAALLFLSASSVIFPALVSCQYDVVSLALALGGLYCYLKKRTVGFFVLFALAVPLKMFALFMFIPLILLREKRIWAICLKLVPAFAVNFVLSLPFRGESWYELCLGTQNRDAIDLIVGSSIKLGKIEFCPFIAVFLAICVACYAVRRESWDDETSTRRFSIPIYAVAAAMVSFVFFVEVRSYWCVIAMPFLLLVVFASESRERVNAMLFVGCSSALTVYFMITHWVFSYSGLTNTLILSYLPRRDGYEALYRAGLQGFFTSHDLARFAPIVFTLAIASAALILWRERPILRKDEGESTLERDDGNSRALIIVQIALCGVLVALTLYASAATRPIALISTESVGYGEDILCTDERAECTFIAPETRSVSELSFTAANEATHRKHRSSVTITITDESGEVIFERLIGTASVPSKQPYKVDLGALELRGGEKYTVTLQGSALRSGDSKFRPAYDIDGELAIELR